MPYARVGVIPPLSTNNDQQSRQMSEGKRSARRKGITMEDLKKLTALRLAQEQQQTHQQSSPSHVEFPSNPPVTTYPSDPRSYPLPTNGPVVIHMQQPQQPIVATREAFSQRSSPEVFVVVNPIESDRNAVLPRPDVHDSHTPTIKQTKKKVMQKKGAAAQAPSVDQSFAPEIEQTVLLNHEPHPRFQRSPEAHSGRSSHTGSPQMDASYQGSGQQSSSKSKLPHGLTVYELKEMTKARLQAEAAEKSDQDVHKTVLFQQPRGSPSPRLSSPNQQLFLHPLPTVESSSPIPPVREHHPDVFPPPSPAFPNYGSSIQLNSALSEISESEFGGNFDMSRSLGLNRDGWQQSSKNDTWETASVASYNSAVASEYLGSESPFTPVVGSLSNQIIDDLGNVPFGRSRSYPTSGGFALNSDYQVYEGAPSNNSGTLGNMYVAVGPNRRRACTLSPRPGLTYLHEDRPMLNCEGLGMPSFSNSSTRNQINPRAPNSYSPILSHSRYSENIRPYGNSNDSSRPRTLSTASLPPISHTADEFALEGKSTQLHYSMGTPISQGFFDQGSVTDSFLHSASSLPSSVNAPNGVAGVFRDSGMGDDLRTPPGLFGGTELHAMSTSSSAGLNLVQSSTSSMDTFGESKMNTKLDSTWGDSHGSVFPLGTGMIQNPSDHMDASLAGDLNSILKLSGATEEPDPVVPRTQGVFNDINGMHNRQFGF